ncbi:MAG: iron-sulfur cluster assembly scaffold protein [Deltaproteobacteria bacterium]|nr:iron-sulfur cluster assembly scaffold protein [Deltaproteobacteria bacterium]MBW2137082.1 iron-sulfur cluster assembly scaffold protein [Deltaproteobacteria bacterium]
MDRDAELFVEDVLAEIRREMEGAYGKAAYERWKSPLFLGKMDDPDGHGCMMGACGDAMQVFLKFEGNRVKEAAFLSDGCGSSTVCGSFAAEIAIGKTPEEILEVTGQDIISKMGTIPEEDRHLADLAAETLKAALRDYQGKRGKHR